MRLGMGQIMVEAGQPQANLDRAVAMIAQSAGAGCDLVILPECLDIGWTDPSARTLAQPIPGSHSERLSTAAKDNSVHVVAGLVERAGPRLFNAAILIDSEGNQRLLHRKINELDIAADLYSVGDRLSVVETRFGVVGVDICADNFPDSLAIGHVLARMGAQIILSPSAWAVPPDHDNLKDPYGTLWITAYQRLSKLYDLPIVGVSGVGRLTDGPWKGWKLIGCSIAMGPDGRVLAQGTYGESAESLIIVDVNLREASVCGTALLSDLQRRGYDGP